MTPRDTGVTAYFPSPEEARVAVDRLTGIGVPRSAIDVQVHGGDTHGGFMEGLKNFFGVGEERAYELGAIVRVVDESRPEVVEALRDCGGEVTGYDGSEGDGEEQRMRLHEERLSVDKRRRQVGEAVVRKEVVTENQQIEVPVQHEEVYIERRSVAESDPRAEDDFDREEELRIPVTRDEVEVHTHPVTTEEVAIGKRRVDETQTVGATVRKERARVETDGEMRPVDEGRDTR